MNAAAILAIVASAISVAQKLYELGKDVGPILEQIYNVTVKGDKVTQVELDELRAQSDAWGVQLQKEIPPEVE